MKIKIKPGDRVRIEKGTQYYSYYESAHKYAKKTHIVVVKEVFFDEIGWIGQGGYMCVVNKNKVRKVDD